MSWLTYTIEGWYWDWRVMIEACKKIRGMVTLKSALDYVIDHESELSTIDKIYMEQLKKRFKNEKSRNT